MEHRLIEHELEIEAAPEVVFEVLTRPEHIQRWWSDQASLDCRPGGAGELIWGDRDQVVPFTVVDVDPPRHFSFRWVAPDGEVATDTNSLLVTFELQPVAAGTRLKFTESGFHAKVWAGSELESNYRDHEAGRNTFLPRLAAHAREIVTR